MKNWVNILEHMTRNRFMCCIVSMFKLPSHKLRQKLANIDNKRSNKLQCLFTAADSIADAFRFIWCIVEWSEKIKFSLKSPVPAGFQFVNPAGLVPAAFDSGIRHNPYSNNSLKLSEDLAYLEIRKVGGGAGSHFRCTFSKVFNTSTTNFDTLNISTKCFHPQRGPGARAL